jgi:hypothetical protein
MDMVTAVKLLPDISVLSCGRDGMIFMWSPTSAHNDANTGPSTCENGAAASRGDNWSDDDDEAMAGTEARGFQPAIFRMYRDDATDRR